LTAKDDCYRLIQLVAIKEAKGICQRPGCGRPAECGHHVFKRDRLTTAFRPDCVVGLCIEDHNGWAHGEPEWFTIFMLGRLGEERYYELQRLSYSRAKESTFDFIGTREQLRGML
jgi:hypothetical protein